MPATSWRSSPPTSTRSTSKRSAFGCGSAARTVPTRSSSARDWAIVITDGSPSPARPSPPAPAPRSRIARGRSRRRGWRTVRPAADHERDADGAGEDGRERRQPGEPVEPGERRRREHLLAVAGPERREDRRLVLTARDPLGDLLLHRL